MIPIARAALFFSALLALDVGPPAFGAEDKKEKKEEKKPEPPHVIVAMPLVISPGYTNKLRLRGTGLADATEAQFTNFPAEMMIKSKSKQEVPKDGDAKKVGDSQMDLEIKMPATAAAGTNWLTISSSNGVSVPHPILVLSTTELLEEKEPNGGFKQAQAVEPGKMIVGSIKEAADVDVFRFVGKSGQRVRIEVTAARLGSALDSIVTLYDSEAHILVVNDDSPGNPDSILKTKLPADGNYFVSVIDAQDRGGPTSVYLLRISFE